MEKIKSMWGILTLMIILFVEAIIFCTCGLNYLTIIWAISVPIYILIGIYILNNLNESEESTFGSLIIIGILISMLLLTGWQYTDAISLPHRYNAACDTVEQIEGLLLKCEQNSSLANGLEALQLKQSLKDAIDKRNDLKAEVDAWLNNSIMPYKDVLKNNLN